MRDYDLAHFAEALAEAEQAYRIDPLPQILFNIGQCHLGLKHWDQAAFFYERYLAKLPDAPNRRRVEELLFEAKSSGAAARQLAVEQAAPTVPALLPSPAAEVPPEALSPFAEKAVEPRHSRAAAYALGAVAVASLVVMVIGIVEVESYQSLVGTLDSPSSSIGYPAWRVQQQQAASEYSQAQVWQWVAGAAGVVAAGTGTGAVLTW